MKLSLATDMARPHLPKSLALEWVTTKTKLPKELTGGGKLTLTPTLRPRMMESKGFLAAADCKAKIELNGPKARAARARAQRRWHEGEVQRAGGGGRQCGGETRVFTGRDRTRRVIDLGPWLRLCQDDRFL